ncbi:MAG: hemolysin III family protein [Chloroflexi bacterium]|nr:hemolysin III family protein [Chloroflexota bacterium]
MISKLREPVNGLTHMGGAFAAVIGLIILLNTAATGVTKLISVLIYGVSLILLFSASAIYHSVDANPGWLEILRKMDHSAIYLLIAGTYTPICMNAFTGFYRWGFLSIIWSLAFIGILIKVYYIAAPRWVSAGTYVLMGWLCVFASRELITSLTPFSLTWLILGGVTYTFGAIIYATKWFNLFPGKFGSHEIWHIFVLAGASAHFMAIFGIISRV